LLAEAGHGGELVIRFLLPYRGTHSRLPGQEALLLQLGQGLAHRVPADTELLLQLRLGGQLLPRGQLPCFDLLPDRLVLHRGLSPDGTETDLKTARSHRSLILPPEILQELREYIAGKAPLADRGFLFVSRTGSPLRPDLLANVFRDLQEECGLDLPRLRLYDLRHSVATNLYLSGEKSKVISDLLGNSVTTMERHYAHVSESASAAALSSYVANLFVDNFEDTKKQATLPDDLNRSESAACGRARDGNRTRDLLLGKLNTICQLLQEVVALLGEQI
jgi:hypothetical protein